MTSFTTQVTSYCAIARTIDRITARNLYAGHPNWIQDIQVFHQDLRNDHDYNMVKTLLIAIFDWIIFETRSPQATFLQSHQQDLMNNYNNALDLFANLTDNQKNIIYSLIDVFNICTRDQKKDLRDYINNAN